MKARSFKKSLVSIFKGLFLCFLLFIVVAAYALFIEPTWLKVKTISLHSSPKVRIVHFSDIHYKGNSNYLARVVNQINDLKPDCVCFSGDLAEKSEYLDEALAVISKINTPMYGCPGNHDHWNNAALDRVRKAFHATGDEWLVDGSAVLSNMGVIVTGYGGMRAFDTTVKDTAAITNNSINICLAHYPAQASLVPTNTFDIILSGHSHGGQVRLPFIGALVMPSGVDEYDRGLFNTPAGPLYVTPGLGTFLLPVRLFCRPEITVIEL